MSEVIRVNKDVKQRLIKISAELQLNRAKRVSLNETIAFLIDFYDKDKEPKKESLTTSISFRFYQRYSRGIYEV